MQFVEHITQDGDRWDLIAHRWYGDALRIDVILRANPIIARLIELPGGMLIRVPVVVEPAIPPAGLPPWAR